MTTHVNIIGKVVPGTGNKLGAPLRNTLDHPLEVSRGGRNSDFELEGKVNEIE